MHQVVGILLSWCRMHEQQSSGEGSWFDQQLSLQVTTTQHSSKRQLCSDAANNATTNSAVAPQHRAALTADSPSVQYMLNSTCPL